jgi:hypothetical protein
MHKKLASILAIFVVIGCDRRPALKDPSNGEANQPLRAELKIGGGQNESRNLAFKITAVHEKQMILPDAPFHADGGEWTFFDCQTSGRHDVVFTVGQIAKSGTGDAVAAWGKSVLIVTDREVGGRFVEIFSKAFAGKLPKTVKQAYAPRPLLINTAILGRNMRREKQGGYSGEQGEWTATKWFPEFDGQSSEIYFNYNIAQREGEFSEKDPEYADDLVAIFASAMRDGPRPERTPENDPNVTRLAPTIGKSRRILSRTAAHQCFSPKSRFAVYENGTAIFALPLDEPEGKPFEIVHFDCSPWTLLVLDDDLTLLVQEGVPESADTRSSADPMRIWWVDGKSGHKTLLKGPEKNLNVEDKPVSPNQRYVVLSQWQGDPRNVGRSKSLHILDRQSGKSVICTLTTKDLSVIGWKNTASGLRLVTVTNRWKFEKNQPSKSYLVDPATGKLEPQENVDGQFEIDNPVSPDGKYRVHVETKELIVTEQGTGKQRRFDFHEDDLRFVGPECIEWVSPRYLKFNGSRLALIDTMTMKMCFPNSADGMKLGSYSCKFSSDLRWVLYQGERSDGEGIFLATVEMPKQP